MTILRCKSHRRPFLSPLPMIFGTFAILTLKASILTVGAMDAGFSVQQWPEERSKTTGLAYQQENRFFLPETFSKINLNINTGQLKVGKSHDGFFHIQTTGEEAALTNLIFSLHAGGLDLEDKNEVPKIETNMINSNIIFGGISGVSVSGISLGDISGDFSIGSTTIRSGGRTVLNHVGYAMKSNSTVKKNGYISQAVLSSFGGQGSTYGELHCEGNQLNKLTMGPNGRIWSGTIIAGKVEQAGKFYGPGTSFNEGIPDQLDMNSTRETTPVIEKIEKPQPKPTEITLLVPSAINGVGFRLDVAGKGDSKTDIKALNFTKFEGAFFDNSAFNAKSVMTPFLKLNGYGNSKIKGSGQVLNEISMNAFENSELEFTHDVPNTNLTSVSLSGKKYGKIKYQGNNSVCNKLFSANLENSAESSIYNLYVVAQNASLNLSNYAKLDFTGCFDKIDIDAKNSAEINLNGGNMAFEKRKKSYLHDKALISTFQLSNYAKINISDWFNKMVINSQNSSEFTYNSTYSTEATQINALNYAKVKLNTQVNRAKIQAKNSAEVYVSAVTEILEDNAQNYAQIKVAKRPNSGFQL